MSIILSVLMCIVMLYILDAVLYGYFAFNNNKWVRDDFDMNTNKTYPFAWFNFKKLWRK